MSIRPSAGLRFLEVDDGAVILLPDPPRFVDLNESAVILWRALQDENWNPNAAARSVAQATHVELDAVERMLDAFVVDLRANGVLTDA